LLNHHADTLGFDAISVGGVLSWMMECLADGSVSAEEMGVTAKPVFEPENFNVVDDSMHNALIGLELLESIIHKRGMVNLTEGARKFARHLARAKGQHVLNSFVYTAYARNGWMVPNQYWTPGALSPMAMMGKYYMNYGNDFIPPRELGRKNAERMVQELVIDNIGLCRFHRGWAEEMIPDIIESLYGMKEKYLQNIRATAARINARNSSVFWESSRSVDYINTFLKRKHEVEGSTDPVLLSWLEKFEADRNAAALDFWYEIHKGVHESLREFQ
jgi:glyceraldehyde-3-phosphate dehydrogenase (ferredoxin)